MAAIIRRVRAHSLLLVLAVTALAGARAVEGDFLEDDFRSVVESRWLESFKGVVDAWLSSPALADKSGGFYRPIAGTTLVVDYALWGRNSAGYHLTNLVLHLACVALLFLLVRRMSTARAAVIAALLFGLHPVPAEAWAYINARSDPIALVFLLATLLAIARAERVSSWQSHALVGALAFLACLGKETAVLCVVFFAVRPRGPADAASRAPVILRPRLVLVSLATALAAYAFLRIVFLGLTPQTGGGAHLRAALSALPVLFGVGGADLILPRHGARRLLAEDMDALGPTGVALLGAAVLVVFAFLAWRGKRRPLLLWGLIGFAFCLAPAALTVVYRWEGLGRYFYLPLAWMAPAVGEWTGEMWQRSRLARVATLAYAVVLTMFLQSTIAALKDEHAMGIAAIDDFPERSHGYARLGMALCRDNDRRRGIPLLERALVIAPPSQENRPTGTRLHNLAKCHFSDRNFVRALALNEVGKRIFQNNVNFYLGASLSSAALGDRIRALENALVGRRIAPSHPGLKQLVRKLGGITPP